tara:strand:- start:30 stop:353 length:324 start_codon:yes stop_codon:yes gene_type:complete
MKKLSMAEKAKKAGLPAQTVYNRMHNGWTEKRALSVPNGNYKKKTVAYKVEPKEEQAVGSRVKTTDSAVKIPMEGIQKFEKQRDNKQMYVAIALGIALVLAVAIATR